jgi:hypothetical protein
MNAGGTISMEDAMAFASTNLEKVLGAEMEAEKADLVATRGGDLLNMGSQIVAIISPSREIVDIL